MTITLEASHCQRLQTVLELEVENGSWRYGRVVPQGSVESGQQTYTASGPTGEGGHRPFPTHVYNLYSYVLI